MPTSLLRASATTPVGLLHTPAAAVSFRNFRRAGVYENGMRLIEREGRIGWWRWRCLRRCGVDYGTWGEWIALGHLLAEGFDVVARGWRCRAGELDLVAYDGDELVFVEVKTRRAPAAFSPEVAVDAGKQARLELLADLFRARYELFDLPARFDLIAVETPDLRHYRLRHYVGFF